MAANKARIPTDEELRRITGRAIAEIIPEQKFVDALLSGRSLRLKMGFDPSAPDLTLGHAVGLRKLRQLQELGHTVVLIVGDWTAQIGDPSGQSKTRPMLTAEEVRANAETYLRQFFKIVDRELTEVRWQSEWFGPFTLADVVRLAARVTVAQMLQREDFGQRFAAQKPISLHEFLYPLLQAYDSVAVKADVEFGGTDQTFNLLVGREVQPYFDQPAQAVVTVPLLVGTDGKMKMSKSLGNYIAVDELPQDMYGKLMSIPDSLIVDYFELLTDVPDEELSLIGGSIEQRSANPMELKMRLAREIVAQFYGERAAREAEGEFVRVFREREEPTAPAEVAFTREIWDELAAEARRAQQKLAAYGQVDRISSLTSEQRAELFPASVGWTDDELERTHVVALPQLLIRLGLTASKSEARRLINQGAVQIDGSTWTEPVAIVREGATIRVGKHRFLRIVDADKRGSAEGATPPLPGS